MEYGQYDQEENSVCEFPKQRERKRETKFEVKATRLKHILRR